uniref:Uncharacterized protein n=1 Tax=Anguilla anguilla TaxID=7936 RepID=A0A0E9UZX6_ANGAN
MPFALFRRPLSPVGHCLNLHCVADVSLEAF